MGRVKGLLERMNPDEMREINGEHWGTKNIMDWRRKTPNYQNGDKNPAWKGGMSKSNICRIVKRVLDAAGVNQKVCSNCKKESNIRLNIHHKNQDRSDNRVENLAVLCPRCHNLEHGKHEHRRNKETGRFSN